MTNEIDWKALFGAYMDYVDEQEGTDFLWLDSGEWGAFRGPLFER